jgi:diguanylate cyclase (GGDEF)-like protein
MAISRRLAPPMVSAAIAMIAVTNFATVKIAKGELTVDSAAFFSIWPIALSSAVAVILVMSFLYRSLMELIGELENREATAKHQAMHDQLTGLPNRALLEDRLDQALGRYRRDGTSAALLVLDLDRFKQVNDTLGHAAGDDLLRQVGQRLLLLLRETDTLARIGGDEFAIVQHGPRNQADVRRLCDRVVAAVAEPFQLTQGEARVGVSIGAVMAAKSITCAAEFLRHGDITMYKAKASGRNCYRIFSDDLDSAVQRRGQIEQRLRQVLAAEGAPGIDLHFQPQLDRQGAVVGAEGLLRWHDEKLGELTPTEVIPIAEECGLISDLGEVVFRKTCRAAARNPGLVIAVNLSPLQLRAKTLPVRLRSIAAEEGVPCDQIEIEVTEGVLIEHIDLCDTVIAQLRASGFRIALDDFGTGYSSLSYLRRFQVDKLKIDRSFLDSAHLDRNIAIVRAAVGLGHALGLQVVAEGISSADQERAALEAGCDLLQGFRYAAAMPIEALATYLETPRAALPRSAAA